MSPASRERLQQLYETVSCEGFAFVDRRAMRRLLEQHGTLHDWDTFAASWNDLPVDSYLARLGRDRRRRHAVCRAEAGGSIAVQPRQPHYQSARHNPLQGDIQRWFAPVATATLDSASLRAVLGFAREFCERLAGRQRDWRVEIHQFRIEARPGQEGQPTPEGMHRDGVDFVLVLMIDRHNIASGVTTIHAPDHREVGRFILTSPLDAALVDDARVFHGVTAVTPLDPDRPAHRDVLVVTFRATEHDRAGAT